MSERWVTLEVEHTTTYEYDDPVSVCHNVVRLTPREESYQGCIFHQLEIDPKPHSLSWRQDFFGNTVHLFTIGAPHRRLRVHAKSTVVRHKQPPPQVETSPPWELVTEQPDRRGADELINVLPFRFASPRVPLSPTLRSYAQESFGPQRPVLSALIELTQRIHADFDYDPKATRVDTPLEQVLSTRRGVCQDLAHVQIGCLRALGLAARYVSGYLRTLPPPGKPRLVGADASHAWVSVHCGALGWVDIDPTNNLLPERDHVTIAWGRDYGDVCPIEGVYVGGGYQHLTVAVDVVTAPSHKDVGQHTPT